MECGHVFHDSLFRDVTLVLSTVLKLQNEGRVSIETLPSESPLRLSRDDVNEGLDLKILHGVGF